jgi:hypothetical protein
MGFHFRSSFSFHGWDLFSKQEQQACQIRRKSQIRPYVSLIMTGPHNLSMILLPNRELMQANFALAMDNSFCKKKKQEWEPRGFQNGTVLESGPPACLIW